MTAHPRLQQLLLTDKAKATHGGDSGRGADAAAAELGGALRRAVAAMTDGGGGRRALSEVSQRPHNICTGSTAAAAMC